MEGDHHPPRGADEVEGADRRGDLRAGIHAVREDTPVREGAVGMDLPLNISNILLRSIGLQN